MVIKQKRDLGNIEKLVEVLSPHNVLRRGYSITYINGKLATSTVDVHVGDQLVTTLQDGTLTSKVQSKNTDQ
jgi:exodeoxyribonuclease VII large subunit